MRRVHMGVERLRRWIDRSQLSQTEAAAIIGIDMTVLSRILSGERRPGLKMAVRIAKKTGIPVEVWLDDSGENLDAFASTGPSIARKSNLVK